MNLGILAHVDAGKTSLTERLLYAAGVLDEIGRVDDGNTQADTSELERRRGITIKTAVVSFVIDDLTVNLIDTPGHPDFIAEVERALSVLDGAVLVVSAVEGVQAQTRVLMRTLRRLRVPTLIFINKIDRVGADDQSVLQSMAKGLTPACVSMGVTKNIGTRDAEFVPHPPEGGDFSALLELLAENDDSLLAAYVDSTPVSSQRLTDSLARQTRGAMLYPVFAGSAVTGAGVTALMGGVRELLPAAEGDAGAPASGRVFKVERDRSGARVAYVRMFSGALHVRDRVPIGEDEGKATAISVFEPGGSSRRQSMSPGHIAKVWGLGDVKIGDMVASPTEGRMSGHQFALPTLETVVVPAFPSEGARLKTALTELSEQDPLINLRQDDVHNELYVSLYGEVQKEVIQATLADEFDLDVTFRESRPICVERPRGEGQAVEYLQDESNPFRATVGLRIEPAAHGSGLRFQLSVDPRTVPTHIYKSVPAFTAMMDEYVRQTLAQGIKGWQVVDAVVTMTHCDYSVADGPPSRRGPDSTAADFRKLTPLVAMHALTRAGTNVCEPIHAFHVDAPPEVFGVLLPAMRQLRAVPHTTDLQGSAGVIEGDVPAARVYDLQLALPGLTGGAGVLESIFDRYEPAVSDVPSRPRTDLNPLNRKEYLLQVQRRRLI